MNRSELEKYIFEKYGISADHPWITHPNHAVFRHKGSRKWFALVMNIPKEKLGISKSGEFDIMNLKCDPMMTGSLRSEDGIYPAYHMNKTSWISVALDGRVDSDKIKMLLEMSFKLTDIKTKEKIRERLHKEVASPFGFVISQYD